MHFKKEKKEKTGDIDSDITLEVANPLLKALQPKSTVRKCSLPVYF